MIEELEKHPERFNFFQAVRLLIQHSSRTERDTPRRPVGYDGDPNREIVRFRALASLSFPGHHVASVKRPRGNAGTRTPGENGPVEMTVSHLGLTGPSGVLPKHYTTLILQRLREKDHSLQEFLDLFHHRILSHFYRAWEKYRFPFSYERAHLNTDESAHTSYEDTFAECMFALTGHLGRHVRGRLDFDDRAFLYYSGHFAHRPRTAETLERMLVDYFRVPVHIRSFAGHWLRLSSADRSRLPGQDRPDGQYNQLGRQVVLGERIWDVEGAFRVELGPLSYSDFCRFMPPGDGLRPLCQLSRSYVGPEFQFDVVPLLKSEEVPECRLDHERTDGPYLGWNTWLRSRPFSEDAADALFTWSEI